MKNINNKWKLWRKNDKKAYIEAFHMLKIQIFVQLFKALTETRFPVANFCLFQRILGLKIEFST